MAHPLTKDDLDNINASLKGIDSVKGIIARAKIAGLDVAEQEQQMVTAEQRLKAIKQGFFPSGRA
tara:strand:- start:550 stop:744 length:195 start_codon:yes stop_codon:yes gene_type:complete